MKECQQPPHPTSLHPALYLPLLLGYRFAFQQGKGMEALQRQPASGKAVLGAKWHMGMTRGGPNQGEHCKRDGVYAQGKPSWMPPGAM